MSDHKKEALAWVNGLDEQYQVTGETDATTVGQPLVGLVHATLYLAEQQRLANLIAVAVAIGEDPVDLDLPWLAGYEAIRLAIREGVGLA